MYELQDSALQASMKGTPRGHEITVEPWPLELSKHFHHCQGQPPHFTPKTLLSSWKNEHQILLQELYIWRYNNCSTAIFRLDKRRLRGDIINAYKYLKGRCQEDGARLFPMVLSDRTRGNRHILKHRKHHLNMRENFLTVRMTEPWNRLPRQAVDIQNPPRRWSCATSSGWTCFGRGVGLDVLQRSLPTPTTQWFCDSLTRSKLVPSWPVTGAFHLRTFWSPCTSLRSAGRCDYPQ